MVIQIDTLKAVDVVKQYCGSEERVKTIFSQGGKLTILRCHPNLANQLRQFSDNTIHNCFRVIKKEITNNINNENSPTPDVTVSDIQENTHHEKKMEEVESSVPPAPLSAKGHRSHRPTTSTKSIQQQRGLGTSIPAPNDAAAAHAPSIIISYPNYPPPANDAKYFVLLNMIHGCIQIASTCGSANDGTENNKLVETLRLAYDHANEMKEHLDTKEHDMIAPRP